MPGDVSQVARNVSGENNETSISSAFISFHLAAPPVVSFDPASVAGFLGESMVIPCSWDDAINIHQRINLDSVESRR